MSTKITLCDCYILLWILQLVHAPLGLYGDGLSVFVLFALFLWALCYCYIAIKRYKLPTFLKAWFFLLCLFTVYGFVRIINPLGLSYVVGTEVSNRNRQFLIEHWTSMLPIFPFYVYSREGRLNVKNMKIWAIVLIGVAIIQYYYGRSLAVEKLAGFADESQVTNNMGYFIAMVMPLMFFWRDKPLVQYVGNAVLMVFVLLAVKRGAILVGFICLVMQVYHSTLKQKKKYSFWGFIIAIAFLVFGYKVITDLLSTNEYFNMRLEATLEGNDSARGDIYSSFIQAFKSTDSFIHLLLGRGANGTLLLLRTQAHNDWLELLINMGIVGFIAFVVFWVRAFRNYKHFQNVDLKYLFIIVILMLFVRTFFSMSINDMYLSTNLVLGYCLANSDNV